MKTVFIWWQCRSCCSSNLFAYCRYWNQFAAKS